MNTNTSCISTHDMITITLIWLVFSLTIINIYELYNVLVTTYICAYILSFYVIWMLRWSVHFAFARWSYSRLPLRFDSHSTFNNYDISHIQCLILLDKHSLQVRYVMLQWVFLLVLWQFNLLRTFLWHILSIT